MFLAFQEKTENTLLPWFFFVLISSFFMFFQLDRIFFHAQYHWKTGLHKGSQNLIFRFRFISSNPKIQVKCSCIISRCWISPRCHSESAVKYLQGRISRNDGNKFCSSKRLSKKTIPSLMRKTYRVSPRG